MKTFNWLHLSDLHFGLAGQVPLWPNIRKVFLDDLSRLHDCSGPWHAIFITGDLTQSAGNEEFDALNERVLSPLWEKLEMLGSKDAMLACVPGNHDLQRPDCMKPTAALRQLTREGGFHEVAEEFWSDGACEYRKVIDTAFENYQLWWKQAPYRAKLSVKNGVLPGDFATTLTIATSGDRTFHVGIAGMNTAFLQLCDGYREGGLACSLRQLHTACEDDIPGWVQRHDFCILLSHHGPQWYDTRTQKEEYAEINPAGRFGVHLFGHMHENVIRSTSIGGGEPMRHWQACSLFGLQNYGELRKIDRRHGYSAGRVEFVDLLPTIRHWPRRAIKDQNGWRFERDAESCVLDERDGGTRPEFAAHPGAPESVFPTALSNNVKTGSTIRVKLDPQPDTTTTRVLGETGWKWPHDEPNLRGYCEAVCRTHSHIRFVEIPYLKDVSDVEMDALYVAPRFCAQEIHPDAPVFRWPRTVEAISALWEHRNLVLLGDPGSGKSTLTSCLAWQLCRPRLPQHNAWTKRFSGCLPLPMVLRELRLKADLTWEGLLEAFLEHRIGRLLPSRQAVDTMLKEGRAIILLDGLDEVSNLAVRRKLRDAIQAGISANPNSRWILTSRIVGYETVPFHFRVEKPSSIPGNNAVLLHQNSSKKKLRVPVADILYLAPFDDQQIRSFSDNWYKQHEKEAELVDSSAQGFVRAIRENEGTQRLARIPYLLTLMALIHHKNARLPHGRTELYERIAAAYLESIDVRRHLDQLPYSLTQKKKWLAGVAYEMQLRRTRKGAEPRQGQLLASKAAVQRWLRTAMTASGVADSKAESQVLLDYFAQRSGLLLPRSEGKFAFMHLSLQEYFAACFLEPCLTAPRFSATSQKAGPSDDQLHAWANNEAWHESYVLLFELLSEKSTQETEAFLNHLFDGRLDGDTHGGQAPAAELLSELATNPFVVLSAKTRCKIRQLCWRWLFGLANDSQRRPMSPNYRTDSVVRNLVVEAQGDLERAWRMASMTHRELRGVEALDLAGCSCISNLSPLRWLRHLKSLNLGGCSGVCDLGPLTELDELRELRLEGCPGVSSIAPLKELRNLKKLFLGSPVDLTPLGSSKSLHEIHLHHAPLSSLVELTPLAGLSTLVMLCLPRSVEGSAKISDDFRNNPDKIASPAVKNIVVRMRPNQPEEEGDLRQLHLGLARERVRTKSTKPKK